MPAERKTDKRVDSESIQTRTSVTTGRSQRLSRWTLLVAASVLGVIVSYSGIAQDGPAAAIDRADGPAQPSESIEIDAEQVPPAPTDPVADQSGAPPAVDELEQLLLQAELAKAELDRATTSLVRMSVFQIEGAEALMARLLAKDVPQQTRQATLKALDASAQLPGDAVAKALMGMLSDLPAELSEDWQSALARFEDKAITDWAEQVAADKTRHSNERRWAIGMMGQCRQPFAAGSLLELTDPQYGLEVQRWAYEALGRLSHLPGLGKDRDAWTQWYNEVRELDEAQWQRMLYVNLLKLSEDRDALALEVRDRLIETKRALYRATAPAQRPALLGQLMQDPLGAVRLLGLDLARQRAEDNGEFGPDLRQALRDRLDDPRARLREESATLLGQLLDGEAADAMAGRLDRGLELEPTVKQAYLNALTQMPRDKALEPAYKLLQNRGLGGSAAGMLAAAQRAGQGDIDFWKRVRERVKRVIADTEVPNPSVVTLFGLVIAPDDDAAWQRIDGWLDAEDERVRVAAATAWAGSERSLDVLAKRSADPVLRPIALKAATERGKTAHALKAVTARRPTELGDIRLWDQAMVAMASRVTPEALLETIDMLADNNGETRQIREQMLTASIEREGKPEDPSHDDVMLLLARATVRLLDNAPALVVLDYEAALMHADKLDPDVAAAAQRGLVDAYLADRRIEEAFKLAGSLLKPEGTLIEGASDHPLVADIASAASRAIERGRNEEAGQTLENLRKLLGSAVSAELDATLLKIEAKLEENAPEPLRRPVPPDPKALEPAS